MEEDGVNFGMIGKRDKRPDGERDGSGSAPGSGSFDRFSSRYEEQPPKFVRTDTFPCRMLNSVDAANTAGFNVIPPLYPSSGADIFNSDGPTAFFYNPSGGGICDASFVKDSIKSQAAMRMSGSGSFVGINHFRYPTFTPTQWQELKRQALIYKHFVSSSPIPADLLSDPSRALSTIPPPYPNLGRTGVGGGGYFNLRFTNNTDPEPGRCRRTDGKKWRCSRDAAPDQKYCERHLHRGRPRSRKPVEQRQRTTTTVPAADAPLFLKSTATAVSKIVDSPKITTSVVPTTAVSHFNVPMTKPSSRGQDSPGGIGFPFLSTAPEKQPRYSDWMSGGGDLEEMHSGNHPLLHQYEEHLNPTYSNQSDPCYTFVNPTLSMDEYQTQDHLSYPPRSFIDAWSNEKPITGIMSSSPPSHLTLSISNNAKDSSSTLQIQMGLGMTDFDLGKSHSLSWINNAAAGGPLSEVLQSGTATSSPHNSNDDGDGAISGSTYTGLGNLKGRRPDEVNSPPQVVVSSPTGVLQRTFVSLSDSSTNSSPTFAVGSRRSEMGGLPWMSLAK